MNYAKINMFLLIVAIAGIAVAIYFLFFNKKDMNTQTEALLQMMGKEKSEVEQPDEPAEPTAEDWKKIYAISEKIYFMKPLTIHDKNFQKKFDSYIQADIEHCKQFYPLVEKIVKEEQLNEEEQAFYDENKEQVDSQVEHKLKVKSDKPEVTAQTNTQESTKDLTKANPPSTKDEKLKIILGFFEDGIPKSTPQLIEMYDKKTKSTTGKNLYRFLKTVEAEQLFFQKIDNLVYYGLSAWFDGKKLKTEFKNKIV